MMRNIYKIAGTAAVTLALFCAGVPRAYSVPAYPWPAVVTQPDGTTVELRLIGDENAHVTSDADGREFRLGNDGFWRPSGRPAAQVLQSKIAKKVLRRSGVQMEAQRTAFPRTGSPHALVVLVDFPDVPFSTPDIQAEFDRMLNLPGFDRREHIGSAADYFRAQSMGQFSPVFDVFGPLRADHTATYYGENDANGDDARAYLLAIEICRKLDGSINFADYDLDGDGYIDNLYFFYAGYGENFAGNKAAWIWPHADHIDNLGVPAVERTFDGKVLNSYGCAAELYGSTGTDVAAIGTFCHEFGHILGLPDTYDVNYSADGSGSHPDQWDIMASGSYLPQTRNCGAVPAGYSALERWLLGWADPTEITQPQLVTLPDLQTTAKSVRISTANPGEFFLIENRQRTVGTYDRYLPYHGMLVWHVDRRDDATLTVTIGSQTRTITCADAWNLENNAINMNASHQCLSIVKASGDGPRNSADTPFPGRQEVKMFTDATTPSMVSWDGTPTGKPITDISENEGVIRFSLLGGDKEVRVGKAEATALTANGFTAVWPECADAVDGYTFRLYAAEVSEPEEVSTFDAAFSSLPDGWFVDGEATYGEGAITIGKSAVNTLYTPLVDLSQGGKLAITARQGGTTPGTLKVMCGDTEVATYMPSDNASTYTVTLPAMTGPVKISFVSERRKPVTISHITLTQTVTDVTLTPLSAFTTSVGPAVTSLPVVGLTPETPYAFTIEAKGFASSESQVVLFTTLPAESSVTEIAVDAADTEWFTLQGVHLPGDPVTPGIYIRRCGSRADKIVIR